MFAQNGPTVREITQGLLQRTMEDLKEYCHSVADERDRLWEHDIPARQLDEAWEDFDRHAGVAGEAGSADSRRAKKAIKRLQQDLLDRLASELESCTSCDKPAKKKRRGEVQALQDTFLGTGPPTSEDLKVRHSDANEALQQGVEALNIMHWIGKKAMWTSEGKIDLDTTPDEFFYGFHGQEINTEFIAYINDNVGEVPAAQPILSRARANMFHMQSDIKHEMARLYEGLGLAIRNTMPPSHHESDTKVLIDTIICETTELKSMEKELNRQQCRLVEIAKVAIASNWSTASFGTCLMLSTMANPGSSEAA